MNIQADAAFIGSLPKVYGKYLVPIFFEPYAKDVATRLQKRQLTSLLETAAGTGVVTRALDEMLPGHVQITSTDLNADMLAEATQLKCKRDVKWQKADATQLPFADESFDAVVCQFGVMFFPDRPKAYAEALRVLKPGGIFIFNVWDNIEYNDFSHAVSQAMETVFPANPPRFLQRTPYSYFDETLITQDVGKGGFKNVPRIETKTFCTTAATADIPALAICYGTPLKNEIEKHDASLIDKAIRVATETIEKRFGSTNLEGKLQAKVVEVVK